MSTFASYRLARNPATALVGLVLLGGLAACQSLPRSAGPDIVEALEQELRRLEQLGLTGQVLIVSGEQTLLARGLGTVRPGAPEPVSMNSVMPLASVSKPLTASAMLALAADGQLTLDDPLGQHLDGLSEQWRPVPLRHLLTHTAGLPAEIFNPAWPGHPRFEPIDREELVRRVNQFPPDHRPGEAFNYSNVGYNLVAAVIEVVSGQPLEQYLHRRLLIQAGIKDIGLLLPNWNERELVSGREGEASSGHHLLEPRLHDGLGWHSRGSSDLLARPGAMAAWWQKLRTSKWLPGPWMQEFLTAQVNQSDGLQYGFGLEFRRGPLGSEIGHTGSDLDFTVDFTWYPDHDLLIYVALADSRWRADQLSSMLARSLLPHLPESLQGGMTGFPGNFRNKTRWWTDAQS